MTINFSIILESANLNIVQNERLRLSLESIFSQPLSRQAVAFFIVTNGNIRPDELNQIISQYPMIQILSAHGQGYEELKIYGAKKAISDIVVFIDSDCIYEPGWLHNILSTFEDSEVKIVSGVTHNEVHSAYDFACAVTNGFRMPHELQAREPFVSDHYHQNGVAFRKSIFDQYPLPTNQPLYRSCSVHARLLAKNQVPIHCQPKAISWHPAPVGGVNFFWLYLLMGHDTFKLSQHLHEPHRYPISYHFINLFQRSIRTPLQRLKATFQSHLVPNKWWFGSLLVIGAAIFFEWLGAMMFFMVGSKTIWKCMPKNIMNSTTSSYRS